ncbi:hypothetical protein CAPTEDRAFT_220038 [Capitella teleta]|uniref:WxxW domain-containing protein n=1 Tax=Capitella teleta TaxID=283909 RepID=R7UMC1_CAPTE|nr:hypothetical protein CAPTEDRAFT_220038 [Capitella teleta]|eukprot:ELU07679.1 hypothetical protein CAPTEDRAFT_220038 [Capitella teleta]
MIGTLLVLTLSASLASSLPYYGYPYGYHGYGYYGGYYGYPFVHPGYYYRQPYLPAAPPAYGPSKLAYHGTLTGDCGSVDGLYYVDQFSFAFCSNGQKTIQPCAAGSANPPLENFKQGSYYNVYEFCSENLVARGYYNRASYYNDIPEPYAKEAKDVPESEEEIYALESNESYESDEHTGYTEEVHGNQDFSLEQMAIEPKGNMGNNGGLICECVGYNIAWNCVAKFGLYCFNRDL